MKKQCVYASVCTTLSCVVGAGFVGGKEVEKFLGKSIWATIMFALLLFVTLFVLLRFCKTQKVTSMMDFSQKLFKRASLVYLWVVAICSYVVVIALFSTTSACLKTLFGNFTNWPVYQLVTAILCLAFASFKKNCIEKSVSVLLPISIIFIVVAYLFADKNLPDVQAVNLDTSTIYCFFNFVPLVTIFAKGKQNKLSIALSVIVLTLLCCMQISLSNKNATLPTLEAVSFSKFFTIWGIVAIYLSGVTSILLCSLPIYDFLSQLIGDKWTVIGTIAFVAIAFSNFGFDKIVEFCYPLIAFVGAFTFVCLATSCIKNATNNKHVACGKKTKV